MSVQITFRNLRAFNIEDLRSVFHDSEAVCSINKAIELLDGCRGYSDKNDILDDIGTAIEFLKYGSVQTSKGD